MSKVIDVFIIRHNGEFEKKSILNECSSLAKEIGCEWIETVHPASAINGGVLGRDVIMVCDEEGKLKSNHKMNTIATSLYAGMPNATDYIAGDVILCCRGNEELESLDENLEEVEMFCRYIKGFLKELRILEV